MKFPLPEIVINPNLPADAVWLVPHIPDGTEEEEAWEILLTKSVIVKHVSPG